jgi:hypothetical protein
MAEFNFGRSARGNSTAVDRRAEAPHWSQFIADELSPSEHFAANKPGCSLSAKQVCKTKPADPIRRRKAGEPARKSASKQSFDEKSCNTVGGFGKSPGEKFRRKV